MTSLDDIGLSEESTSDDDNDAIQKEILGELGYTGSFECWTDFFSGLCVQSLDDQGQSLGDFIHSTQCITPSHSLEPVDSFLRSPTQYWPNYDDDDITNRWNELLDNVHRISNGEVDVRYLTKPFGPLAATLSFVWHYPTFRSDRTIRGSTFDPSNPSLRWLTKKIGIDSSVRVLNRIFLRHKFEKEVKWDAEVRGWLHIEQEFLAFNRWLNTFSRVVVLVGETNCRTDSIRDLIHVKEEEELVKVPYQLNCQMFGDVPYCMLVRDSKTKMVRQLILLSYHSQAWLGDRLRLIPALHDCIYNAACEIAQIWYEDGTLFSRDAFRLSAAETRRKNTRRFTPATIVAQEKCTGMKVSKGYLRQNFSRFILKHAEFFSDTMPQKNESYAEGLLDFMRTQGHMTQAANGYPGLKKGAEIHAAKGYPNLTQGRFTQSKKGYPNLQQGHRSQTDQKAATREAKVAAILRLKQVQELLHRYNEALKITTTERAFCDIIRAFDTDNTTHHEWLRQVLRRCVFWSLSTPRGLRFENDGCPEPDTFDYSGTYHPAFKMKGRFSMAEIQAFKTSV